jgi:hypothetical protein
MLKYRAYNVNGNPENSFDNRAAILNQMAIIPDYYDEGWKEWK